ncbi:HNH endonuclease [Anaerobacillus isosaccharinicus]|uniref:HNH endonuclease n=1 Tax=Anaerobacillus isosaccharinicus TaxID=1532552 RepID=A0A1S2L9R3_9BACI|nr:HNH endonuclease [Anaerobacillus isosaccharinicus]MBA5584556.1 HNH endonuclease [Anaerobacillus isosaccharinicus]QOY37060.1 HNH endonuclease [Anaerobacillus isosaccharinicus]
MGAIRQFIKWRDVSGYEGFYQINNIGQIYSCHSNKILTNYVSSDGYLRVNLSVRGKVKIKMVHVLVAQTFIPNEKELPVVNHIDGNKLNPNVNNLEWVTHSENTRHAFEIGLAKPSEKSREHARKVAAKNGAKTTSKPVIQYTVDGDKVAEFPSIKAACRATGANDGYMSMVCRRKKQTAGGFVWRYKDDPEFY